MDEQVRQERDAAVARELLRLVRESGDREVMNAKEAADFLRLAPSSFGSLAPSLPRVKLRERGGYRYPRSDLLAWLEERRDGPWTVEREIQRAYEDSKAVTGKRGPRKKVKRLI
ncbi:hypothetical protein GBA63_14695 [Rubrobacter tropicus]|uniref:Helix-turn-helix domain-containing protein n=1 Tax=Rubrobacter tropicus TaxID=2653851 RepID=A0A6G8QBE0_9ACTN|nr:helix-turn-helix domain-containing protein [Rubrobacter tropicus]QIN83742.1 hypothetical protein GBA63_14695 [Rubrobacter tropicus]